jgi:predicted RNA-binding protein YlqC (UPF0109 family)
MKDLIEYMARAIVDYPDEVVVTEEKGEDHIVFRLRVAESDMGKVIGKQGRIANAMRALLKVAAIRKGTRAVLEIGEGVTRPGFRGEPRPEAEREPEAELEPEAEPEAEPEPEAELEPEAEPEPEPEAEREPEPEPEPEAEAEPEAELEPEAEPETKSGDEA